MSDARAIYKEGFKSFVDGQVGEAIAKYRESLKYLPDPRLEGYISQLEANANKLDQDAKQKNAARDHTPETRACRLP